MSTTSTLKLPIDTEMEKKARAKTEREGIDFHQFFGDILSKVLKEFIKKEGLATDLRIRLVEEPTEHFKTELKKAKESRKRGHSSPIFTNAEDGIKWLNS